MQHTAKRYATRCQATSSKPFIGRLGAATYTYILMCKRLYKFFHKTFSITGTEVALYSELMNTISPLRSMYRRGEERIQSQYQRDIRSSGVQPPPKAL